MVDFAKRLQAARERKRLAGEKQHAEGERADVFASVKVGDIVAIKTPTLVAETIDFRAVTHVTARQFRVGSNRYSKHTGQRIGGQSRGVHALPMTEELWARKAAKDLRDRAVKIFGADLVHPASDAQVRCALHWWEFAVSALKGLPESSVTSHSARQAAPKAPKRSSTDRVRGADRE